ncbi:hypothetical protein ABK040_000471 [Willaertia magna]
MHHTTHDNNNNNTSDITNNNSEKKEKEILLSFDGIQVEKQIESWRNKLEEYKCPISQQVMKNPVILETGQTFEKKFIEEWLKKYDTCPTTGIRLEFKKIISNYTLRSIINKKIKKFILNVIENVKLWKRDEYLFGMCISLLDECLELIIDNDTVKELQKDLLILKSDVLLEQKNINENILFEDFLLIINQLDDINLKTLQLIKLGDILIKKLDYNLIDKVLNTFKEAKYILEFISILIKIKDYNKNNLLKRLVNVEMNGTNKDEIINLFNTIFKKIKNYDKIDLECLLQKIKKVEELTEIIEIIYSKLYNKKKELKYLENL